jgi:hypothetical protein
VKPKNKNGEGDFLKILRGEFPPCKDVFPYLGWEKKSKDVG